MLRPARPVKIVTHSGVMSWDFFCIIIMTLIHGCIEFIRRAALIVLDLMCVASRPNQT